MGCTLKEKDLLLKEYDSLHMKIDLFYLRKKKNSFDRATCPYSVSVSLITQIIQVSC